MFQKKTSLFFRLHAFGNDIQLQAVCHGEMVRTIVSSLLLIATSRMNERSILNCQGGGTDHERARLFVVEPSGLDLLHPL
jgi:hypothetical protein